MISGGLDSLLAVAVLKIQGIELAGIHFLNGFSPENMKRRVYDGVSPEDIASEKGIRLSELFGIPVDAVDVSREFLEVMHSPRHGFGRNINPCIDCKIFMAEKAGERMEAVRADFVLTGEVLGQRPMSQHMAALRTVERESGLQGLLLRPLSARLLPPTEVEKKGLVDRTRLLDIQGRSRRRQFELAALYGVTGYGTPAGGCALTDENYARRYLDLLGHSGGEPLSTEDMILLSTGRHLRISARTRLVVGRNRQENEYLERIWAGGRLATTPDHPGPTVLILGDPDDGELAAAASVTARYSDGKGMNVVRVVVTEGETRREFDVAPAADGELERWRV